MEQNISLSSNISNLKSQTIASIDIGSNTVLLLIAKVGNSEIKPIINKYRMPRISAGLGQTGIISDESIKKLFDVLSEYKRIIEEHSCEKVIVNGTQALRVAKNRDYIKSEIKRRFGFELNIIPGETEALYSFKGAISSFSKGKNYTMIDIGGASTEIVFGNFDEIYFRKSFPIGAVAGKERFLKSNPPVEEEINKFKTELKNIFKELTLTQSEFNSSSIIAVAGTPTTLTALKQGLTEYSETKVEKSLLSKKDLGYYISQFQKLTYQEIKEQFSPIIAGREDIILSGSLILLHLMETFNKNELFVSGRGLRYGALLVSD